MKKLILLIFTTLLIISLAACSSVATSSVESTASTESQNTTPSTSAATESITAVEPTSSDTVLADTHEQPDDYSWNTEDEVLITLSGATGSADGGGVTVVDNRVTIHQAGTYRLNGTLMDGQVIVDTTDKETVRLILDGVEITSNNTSPLFVSKAEKVILILPENSKNTLTDGAAYTLLDAEENEPNAAIFSKADLTIYGSGELIVNANYMDGITSKDGLLINGGEISVNAVDDGIRGKNYLVVKDGNITINTTGDGLKSDEQGDASLGYIRIDGGNLEVTTSGDAINAQTNVVINNGTLLLASGGGSGTWLEESLSAKAIKGVTSVVINGGTITTNSADDSIHSNSAITINGGVFFLASGDDGMHADETLTINGGEIDISESYEGIESAVITINDCELHINSSDDGINVASGVDGSGMDNGWFGDPGAGAPPQPGVDGSGTGDGWFGDPGAGAPPQPGGQLGSFGQDTFSASGDYFLYINGGYVVVNAGGDGIDVNGSVEMTDGLVLVNGPTENMNGALDYMGTFNISGGTLVAAGSAGMAMSPSESSSQNSLLVNFDSTLPAGTTFHIEDESGQDVLTFTPTKDFQSLAFSSADLDIGTTYNIYTGGNTSGEVSDGLAINPAYSGGTKYNSFTLSGIVTTMGNVFSQGPGGGHRR